MKTPKAYCIANTAKLLLLCWVYMYRQMREIGGNEHQLFGFFKCVMDHGVMVRTLEYSLPARLQQYELGEKIENYAAKHNRPMPWVV